MESTTRMRMTEESTQNNNAAEAETEAESEECCPECSGRIISDERRGESVCDDCGLVIDENAIDHGPEWRAFNATEQDQKSRVGSPTTKMMHDKGLSTKIGWANKDGYGKSLSASQRQKMQRLRTWNERTRAKDSQERNLQQALGEIDRMCSALGIPDDVREMSSVVYRRALKEDMIRGRSIEAMTGGAVHAACRQAGIPRTLNDIGKVARVDKQEISRAFRYLSHELGMENKPPEPERYVARVASNVNASEPIKQDAQKLLSVLVEKGLHSGKTPSGLAAAALYAASQRISPPKKGLTQAALSNAADVCEVTVRTRSKEMLRLAAEEEVMPEVSLEDDETWKTPRGSTNDSTDNHSTTPTSAPDESPDEEAADDTSETEVPDSDKTTLVAAIEEGETQTDMMARAVNTLITEYDLLDSITPDYSAPRCSNPLVIEGENEENYDFNATWNTLTSGHKLQTKLNGADKKRRLSQLANEVGVEVVFEGW